jgi:serine protease Do
MNRFVVVLLTCAFLSISTTGYVLHGQGQAPIPTEPSSFRDVVKKVLPAVVSIDAKPKGAKLPPPAPRPIPQDPNQVPEEFRRFFDEFGRMPDPNEGPKLGFGSGFFIDPSGVILTNLHVVDGAEQITVTLLDGRKFSAKNVRGDRRTDLAVVILDQKGPFPALTLGDSDAMEIGDRVLAVGAPFGLTGSVTAGIISAKGRNGLNMNKYEDFLQTDAAINPGNSGGPLVNLEGKVVGINAAIKSRSGGFQGVGLAVASNLARHVAESLQNEGIVRRGYLGVQIRDLNPEVAQRMKLPAETGVVVGEVFDNTPAAKSGLQAGDVIITIAGKKVRDANVLQRLVADLPLQKPSEIRVLRDGQPVNVPVVIEEQPKEYGSATAPAQRQNRVIAGGVPIAETGIEIADLTDALADDLGFRSGTRGAVIARVDLESSAANAGLRRGMIITRADDAKIANVAQIQQALAPANLQRGVLLQVQSPQGGVNYVLLRSDKK